MSPEEIDRLLKAIESRGASISVQDERVTRWRDWVMTLLGGAILLTLAWVATTLIQLKESVAQGNERYQSLLETVRDHSERLRELERTEHERGR
jgi:hypothetical protein